MKIQRRDNSGRFAKGFDEYEWVTPRQRKIRAILSTLFVLAIIAAWFFEMWGAHV